MNMGRANIEIFSDTLIELASQDPSVIVVTSDSRGSGKLVPFGQQFPDQIVEVGIAEQTLVGVAAGLASTGKKVFAVSPASFLTARALEQIKNDVAYSNNPVTLVGISAGVSYGALGSTHHSLHDLAALRAINNIQVVVPADNFETRQAILAATTSSSPTYIRIGKRPMPDVHPPHAPFHIGKATEVRDGCDLAFIATGETVALAVEASEHLDRAGVFTRVISAHTIKPIDREAILDAARDTNAMITVEEHSVHGGLGEACAAILLQEGLSPAFQIVGMPDEYTVSGSQQEIFKHYGLSGEALADSARKLLDRSGATTP
jgi:transketolase